MQHYGVLQIEPTDFCNLRCKMCAPHAEAREKVHGESPKGFIELELFQKIIDDIKRDGIKFDHLIFQWLGDPTLHPALPDMLDYAVTHAQSQFNYFRIDTNAIRLTERFADRVLDVASRHPGTEILLIFSLDAVTRETYRKVKGVDAFEVVHKNVRSFLEKREKFDMQRVRLHCEFQFVLQPGNFHEARLFVDLWRHELEARRRPGQWDDIMVKRLSAGSIGISQEESDRLYDRTLAEQGIHALETDTLAVKVWDRSPWGN